MVKITRFSGEYADKAGTMMLKMSAGILILVSVGLFLIGAPVGFIGTGVILVTLAIYIDRTSNYK